MRDFAKIPRAMQFTVFRVRTFAGIVSKISACIAWAVAANSSLADEKTTGAVPVRWDISENHDLKNIPVSLTGGKPLDVTKYGINQPFVIQRPLWLEVALPKGKTIRGEFEMTWIDCRQDHEIQELFLAGGRQRPADAYKLAAQYVRYFDFGEDLQKKLEEWFKRQAANPMQFDEALELNDNNKPIMAVSVSIRDSFDRMRPWIVCVQFYFKEPGK